MKKTILSLTVLCLLSIYANAIKPADVKLQLTHNQHNKSSKQIKGNPNNYPLDKFIKKVDAFCSSNGYKKSFAKKEKSGALTAYLKKPNSNKYIVISISGVVTLDQMPEEYKKEFEIFEYKGVTCLYYKRAGNNPSYYVIVTKAPYETSILVRLNHLASKEEILEIYEKFDF